jgi:cytochrome c-type biogenesis protein CcmE
VATGTLTESTVIVAHEVLAKHDEEYMPPELAEKLGITHTPPKEAGY